MLGKNRVRVERHIAISEEIRLLLKLIRSIEETIDLCFFIQFNERVKYSIKKIEKVPFLKQAIISEVLRIPKQFNNKKSSHAGIYCGALRYVFLVIAPQLLYLSDLNSINAYGIPMHTLICPIL
jgi:hypothetical protein